MSILSVDTIQPIGSGSTVTLNAAKIVVGTGITFESNGQAIYAGIITATSFSGSGANLTSLPAGQLTGTVADARITTLTASKLSGALPAISGANLTSLPAQVTISNNANNRVITGGSGTNLVGEANLTFDGSGQLSIAHTDPKIALVDTTNNTDCYIFSDDNGSLRFQADQNSEASDTRIRFQTDGTERVSIDSELKIFNGNLIIGTSGKGIDFSATSGTPSNGGELLDDYEEGNFTPRLGGISNYGAYNVTGQGHYVKIGKVVHINIAFGNIDLNNSASGRVMIYNLPFAPFIVSGTDCRGVTSNYMSHKVQHANDGMIHSWYVETTYGSFQGQITKNNTNWTSWDASNFTATGVYIDFSATYFTLS